MLKGDVFANQIFENQIFALFQNTFLGGTNGICNGYKNSMEVTYSGSNLTIDSGAICIQGRFLEEDSTTTIAASTDNSFCKLIIEIDLDKTNTDEEFKQGYYKIIKGTSDYPALTQTDIVNNVSGIYQYELARFKAGSTGISEFTDMRTYLDFDSLYAEIQQHIQDIDDGSLYVQKSQLVTLTGTMTGTGADNIEKEINYPTGLNNTNCVVLSAMLHRGGNTVGEYAVGSTFDSVSYLRGGIPFVVSLNNSAIKIRAKNISLANGSTVVVSTISDTISFDYKVVLLKIS